MYLLPPKKGAEASGPLLVLISAGDERSVGWYDKVTDNAPAWLGWMLPYSAKSLNVGDMYPSTEPVSVLVTKM